MLLLHDPAPPFTAKRLARLRFLERHVHQRIDRLAAALITVTDYQALLLRAGVPASGETTERRALERDLKDYAAYCDNFVPTREVIVGRPLAGSSAGYALDVDASRDAIRYFLGDPWLAAPLCPRLSSAIARCFLLAMVEGQEVEFEYRRVPRAGESWTPRRLRGIPLRVVAGNDSAYLQLLGQRGIFTINLARVGCPVFWTGFQRPEQSRIKEGYTRIILEFPSVDDARALVETFVGLERNGPIVSIVVPREQATMIVDRLASYLYRTRQRPGEQASCLLPGGIQLTQISLREEEC